MFKNYFRKSRHTQQTSNNNDNIENILRSFRPSPSRKIYQWAATEGWRDQVVAPKWGIAGRLQQLSIHTAGIVGVVVLLIGFFMFTSYGRSYAQALFSFFQYASFNHRSEVVSVAPTLPPDPNYPFSQYGLTLIQAQEQAGFAAIFPDNLPKEIVFRGARFDADLQQIGLIFIFDPLADAKNGSYQGTIFVSEQKSDFQQGWGVCPSGTIQEVDINSYPGEIAEGTSWVTDQRAEPGVTREWVCYGGNDTIALRWETSALKIEINVSQLPNDRRYYFSREDMIRFAKSFKPFVSVK